MATGPPLSAGLSLLRADRTGEAPEEDDGGTTEDRELVAQSFSEDLFSFAGSASSNNQARVFLRLEDFGRMRERLPERCARKVGAAFLAAALLLASAAMLRGGAAAPALGAGPMQDRFRRARDFVGLWDSTELASPAVVLPAGPGEEADVEIRSRGQPWSPAYGTVQGAVLTLQSPSQLRGLEVVASDGRLVSSQAVLTRSTGGADIDAARAVEGDWQAIARLYERANAAAGNETNVSELDTTTSTKTSTTTGAPTTVTTTTTAKPSAVRFALGALGYSACPGGRVRLSNLDECKEYAAEITTDAESCGYRAGCEDAGSAEEWCARAPSEGCFQNVSSGCVSFKGLGPSIANDETRPVCMNVTSVQISGAAGSNAMWINGAYDPVQGTLYNGMPLFQKRDDVGRWLRYTTSGGWNNWRVSDTANKDANDDIGYCYSEGTGQFDPTTVRGWWVWDAGWVRGDDVSLSMTLTLQEIEAQKRAKQQKEVEKASKVASTATFKDEKHYQDTMATLQKAQKIAKPWFKAIAQMTSKTKPGRWLEMSKRSWKPTRKGDPGLAPKKLPSKGLRTVTMGRFLLNAFLNSRYTERRGDNFTINGRESYWSHAGFILYYCQYYDRWMIAHSDNFAQLRSGECFFWAQQVEQEVLLKAQDDGKEKGWFEWDSAAQVLVIRKNAGPDVISSEGQMAERKDYYDAWRGYKKCGKVFYDRGVRNQGRSCNNCWAMATATVIEWRLCLAMNGTFKGPNAAISAGYITSCATDAYLGANGCNGGDMVAALRWVGVHGVPTGGDGNSVDTCVPNFQNGETAENAPPPRDMTGTDVPPSCPQKCTNKDYPRPLQRDLFHLRKLSESWRTDAFESAQQAIREYGPIMINFDVYEDFLGYTNDGPRAIYKHSPNSTKLYSHVVVAIGYSWSPRYLICLNSWGNNWGNEGRFKIDPSEIHYYVIPGDVNSQYPNGFAVPLPNGRTSFELWTDGFRQPLLNDKWTPTTKKKKSQWVADKRTLWNPDRTMFIYYCAWKERWAISVRQNFKKIRDEGYCYWHALASSKCKYLLDLECDWEEYEESEGLVLREGSGVSGVNYA